MIAINKIYPLSPDAFVAGNSREFMFNPHNEDTGQPLDIAGSKVYFSLIDYVNQGYGEPVVSKDAELVPSGDGRAYHAIAKLSAQETISLWGKYIYQFTVIAPDGDTWSGKGLVDITNNTNRAVIAGS